MSKLVGMDGVLRGGWRRIAVVVGLMAPTVVMSGLRADAAPTAGMTVTGGGFAAKTGVFRDFDADGVWDATEPGEGGIAVAATCVADTGLGPTSIDDTYTTPVTTTTAADGSYSLAATGSPCRVEFTIPIDRPYLFSGVAGASLVQFVSASGAVSAALSNPGQYTGTSTPDLTAVQQWNGDPTSDAGAKRALTQFTYLAGPPTTVETFGTLGNLWGLAFHRTTDTYFASAAMRRHAGLGSGGIDAIYAVGAGAPAAWATPFTASDTDPGNVVLPNNDGNTANDATNQAAERGLKASADPSYDVAAFGQVGTVGWGGLAMSDDDSTLLGVNLGSKSLVGIDIATKSVDFTAAVPNPGCSGGEARPWGVTVRDGFAYVGVVCDGSTGTDADLGAFVFAYNLAAVASALPSGTTVAPGAWSTNLLSDAVPAAGMQLAYTKGNVAPGVGTNWHRWVNTFTASDYEVFSGLSISRIRPTPVLSDLSFDNDGSMILGFMDRSGSQLGFFNYLPTPPSTTTIISYIGGDVLRTSPPTAAGGSYVLESNGTTTRGASMGGGTMTGTGTANNQGPGGGEFYRVDNWGDFHSETSLGAMAFVPGNLDFVLMVMDSISAGAANHGGAGWFTANGQNVPGQWGPMAPLVRSNKLYGPEAVQTTAEGFGKSNGLGDIVALADLAPVEIGNRVWNDANGNGVQDPGEPGIGGVVVQLTDGTNTSSATTDGTGNYSFSSAASGPGGTGAKYGLAWLKAGAAVTVTFPTTTAAGSLTLANATTGTGSDFRDSDPGASGNVALVIGGPGENNHTIDAGYSTIVQTRYDLALAKISTTTQVTANGQLVSWTVRVKNQGTVASGPFTVTDTLPIGLTYNGDAAVGAGQLAFATANVAGGVLTIDWTNAAGLPVDGFVDVTFTTAVTDIAAGPFRNWAEISADSGADADSTPDQLTGSGDTPPADPYVSVDTLATLDTDGVPAADEDDNDDAAVAAVVPVKVSLGNHVWLDVNNDGDFDSATETPIDGATVRLFRPGYGADGAPGNADDDLQIGVDQLTTNGGYYLFTDLATGDYLVEVVTPTGTRSSTGASGTFEGAATPDADTVATDSDDNGTMATATTTRSLLVTLSGGDEPTGEPPTPGHADSTPDASANYTIDFGFTPVYAVGNIVWFDADNDGIQDGTAAGEPPVQGAIVRIYQADGTEVPVGLDGVLGTADDGPDGVTTLADGLYYFDNLVPGDYYVVFTAPSGYGGFTTNAPAAPDAAKDSNPDPTPGANLGRTPNFTLGETLPAVDAAAGDPATLVGGKIDRTVDAGVVVSYSLGNRVWLDPDNSGDMNGTEAGVGLVVVNLLKGDGTPYTIGGVAVTDSTDGDGFYRFDNLPAGDYIVEIAAANFAAAGPLAGGLPSTGAAQEADPNSDGDINDNGLDTLVAGAIRSAAVTLGAGLATEPIGEVATQLEGSGQGAIDARANMTVDFGVFVPVYSIGNVVWFDADRDGIQDGVAAGETPVQGAVVKLFRVADGSEVAVGPDGVLGTADDATGGVTTLADGLYYFDNLPSGDYYVTFTAPTGMTLTTDAPAAPDALNDSNPDPATGRTPDFTLGQTLPAVDAAAGDPATLLGGKIDRTIDAGVVVAYSLGNRVWADTDNSGDMNGAEAGIEDVLVRLLKADGSAYTVAGVALTDTTDSIGFYRFDDLPAGDYLVEIAASNFAVSGPLYAGHPSTGAAQEAAPNTDGDINDNGLDTLVAGAIRSAAVTLGAGLATEPVGEVVGQLEASGQGTVDARANMTVDFGIYTPIYTLGNLVWSDFDNDGTVDVGEDPIDGVDVELWMDDPANPGTLLAAVDAAGTPVPTQTTGADGLYLFTNLLEGTYVVKLPAGQPELDKAVSSGTPNPAAGDDVDGDNNAVGQADGSFQSGPVVLGPLGSEPTDEVDGLATGQADQDGSITDNVGNWSVDFGFFRGIRIGNLVWLDGLVGDGATYDNGVVDAGETPLTAVTVELWRDNGDGVFNPASDIKIDETATNNDGNYWFEGLTPADNVFLAIPSVSAPTPGLGARSSTGQSAGADTADNDDDGAAVGTYASVSALFTVPVAGASPLAESDAIPAADGSAETEANTAGNAFPDGNSDLRLDFGFVEVPRYRIGNLVWIDADKDGRADVGEAPIPGVRVELFDDASNFSSFVTTGNDGKWLFENLPGGTYEVRIPTGQAVLDGYFTSPVDEASANADGDNLDNGRLDAGGTFFTSGLVTLGNGDLADEPTTEVDGLLNGTTDDDAGTPASPDDRSNLTVDFGFYQPRFALGNEVWFDLDNSGSIDTAEGYVPDGVIVNLLDGTGDPVLVAGVAVTTTTTAGRYVFDNLLVGDYIVELAASNFATGGPLAGYRSSTGQSTGQLLAADGADHGDDDESDGVRSGVFTLVEGTMPAAEDPNETTTAPDTNANMVADFGIYPTFSLGNEVWIDADDSGTVNNAEAYVADGVALNLLHGDGTPVMVGGVALTDSTVGGMYLFEDLPAGDYIVELAASNFAVGGPLYGYRSSTSTATDDQVDHDDNGAAHAAGGIRTTSIHLGGVAAEPATETPTSPTTARDTNSDLTVDLGVVPVFALGNEVWIDLDDSGTINNGEAYVPNGTVVNLLQGDGTPVLDGAGVAVSTTTTNGVYLFDGLLIGDYIVELAASNFVAGAPLAGYRSSTPTGSDDQVDHNDDGAPAAGGSIRSAIIHLGGAGAEPTGETPSAMTTTVDGNHDLTVDFGLVPVFAIGNEVWFDLDDSGAINGTEGYVPDGVIVNLLRPDGTPVLNGAGTAVSTTTVAGRYSFDNLIAGSYIVEVAASNFMTAGLLETWRSSTGASADETITADGVDHGDDVESDGVRSGAFTLGLNSEPTAEDPNETTVAQDGNANMVADFGIVPMYAIGNEVWFDLDDSGAVNGTEPYVPDGVIVNLLHGDGTPMLDAAGTAVTTTTTAGRYFFDDLLEGDYIVELAASNFAGGGLLAGYRSSTLNAGDDQVDRNDNGGLHASGAVRSTVIHLGGVAAEPAGETPTSPVTARDTNTDLTVDFGVVPSFSIGNEVWYDLDDSGAVNNAEPSVPDGVKVNLLKGDGTPVLDGAGAPVSTLTTGGKYLFAGLLAGTYIVEIDAANLSAMGLLAGSRSSTFTGVDNDSDRDDNGAPAAAGGGIRSTPIVLALNAEPLLENPDNDLATRDENENLTVDFGIVPLFSIGNEVWHDANDDGMRGDPAVEPYVADGIVVNLFDGTGSPVLDAAGVARTTTTVGGKYLFSGLLAGAYIVELAPSNFAAGAPLDDHRSSTLNAPENGVDHDDNGAPISATDPFRSGVRSPVFTLSVGAEPTAEDVDNDLVTADWNENLTLDFGVFKPVFSIGNTVWYDLDDDGVYEAGEPPVPTGTPVTLVDAIGNVVDSTTTDPFGLYLFTGLPRGDYRVEVGLSPGYRSSTPTESGDVDGKDHGDNATNQAGAQIVRTVLVSLDEGTEPTGEGPDNDPTTPDGNENLTVDIGLVPLFSLGNEVWFDLDDNGVHDVAGEPSVPNGVVVNLLRGDGTPVLDPMGETVSVPVIGGMYLFRNLLAGDYIVELAAQNFVAGGLVEHWVSSTGQTTADTDRTDHGAPHASGSIRSGVVTLSLGGEPTAEDPSNDEVTPDTNSNLTVDFGLVRLALGNRLWIDTDGDGTRDDGEPGIGGVTVELWPVDAAGQIGAAPIVTTETDPNGYYLFDGVAPGTYVVRIPTSQFAVGGPLAGYISTEGNGAIAPDPDDNTDADDNGTQDETTGWIQTLPFDLRAGTEPTAEADVASGMSQVINEIDLDANINLTIDLGVVATPPLSLGNRVWRDLDNDGVMQDSEAPIDGVTVQLFRDDNGDGIRDSDVAFQTDVTAGGGFYLFTGLAPGKYVVVIPQANFAAGGPLAHLASSTGSHPADDGVDVDDSGVGKGGPAQDVVSSTVMLSFYDEPTTETQIGADPDSASNNNSNLTVDFGFYPLGSLGDFVWIDTNRDGVQNPSEVGVDGVKVNVYDVNGTLVGTTTTAGGGKYLIEDLIPGGYTVEFVLSTLPAGHLVTAPGATGSTESDDSDGDPVTGRTAVFTVVPGGYEPRIDLGIFPAEVDLAVAKTVVGDVVADRNSTWKILVSNQGRDAENGTITVIDDLPAQLAFVSATGTGWACTATGQKITCTTDADLPGNGALPEILVVAKVAKGVTGQIVNGATVTSPSTDLVQPNNASLAAAPVVKGGVLPGTGADVARILAIALALLFVGIASRHLGRRRLRSVPG